MKQVIRQSELNEATLLSIKRLSEKKVSYKDIADRIGISVEMVKSVCKNKPNPNIMCSEQYYAEIGCDEGWVMKST